MGRRRNLSPKPFWKKDGMVITNERPRGPGCRSQRVTQQQLACSLICLRACLKFTKGED